MPFLCYSHSDKCRYGLPRTLVCVLHVGSATYVPFGNPAGCASWRNWQPDRSVDWWMVVAEGCVWPILFGPC